MKNNKTVAILALVLSLVLRNFSISADAQEVSSAMRSLQSPETTFHSSSNLVLVDVIALNAKDGLPDKTLKRDDFEVFDNAHLVSVKTFDSGAQLTTRPLALWFVVQCNMGQDKNHDAKGGSGLFRGQISLFKPALKYVDKRDTGGSRSLV